MSRDRTRPYYARPFLELDRVPPPPATNAITEGDLFLGYSGLLTRRRIPPFVSAETVRRSHAAADVDEDADGPGGHDAVGAPQHDGAGTTST